MIAPRSGAPLILTSTVGGDTTRPGRGVAPRLDYLELARVTGGRVVHPLTARGPLAALEARLRRFGDWRQGWRAMRSDACAFVSLSEKAALAPALLDRARPHVAVAHNLTTPRRRQLQERTGWLSRLDRIVVLTTPQARYLCEEVGLPRERVRVVRDHVDDRFFEPSGRAPERFVLSVGQTRRDYPTLLEAVAALDAPTTVVASSLWTGRAPELRDGDRGVSVRAGISARELRHLYDRASVVVVPLEAGLDFAAGVNAVLEAMSMARPLVVTATPGIADYVEDGVNCLLVPAGEPRALLSAIERLLDDRRLAERLGAAGRAVIERERTLDAYVAALVAIMDEVTAASTCPPAPRRRRPSRAG